MQDDNDFREVVMGDDNKPGDTLDNKDGNNVNPDNNNSNKENNDY